MGESFLSAANDSFVSVINLTQATEPVAEIQNGKQTPSDKSHNSGLNESSIHHCHDSEGAHNLSGAGSLFSDIMSPCAGLVDDRHDTVSNSVNVPPGLTPLDDACDPNIEFSVD